jgi:RHS repeat-associated protein
MKPVAHIPRSTDKPRHGTQPPLPKLGLTGRPTPLLLEEKGLGDEVDATKERPLMDFTYSYDSLYRLTYSQGWFYDYQSTPYSRTTQMQYSAAGNILSKTVNASLLLDGAVVNKNYTHQYTYDTIRPHILATAGNSTFNWDLNGNMTRHDSRVLCWDEENRLGSARDPEQLAAYLYNAGGERVWKFTGEVSQMGQSGETVIEQVSLRNKTLYASSFFVPNDQGYTKHYFAGSERICSKLGGGLDLAPIDPMGDGVEALYENHTEIAQHLYNLLMKFANCNPEPEQQTVTYIDIDHFLGGIEEQLTQNKPETNRFFYHPDHLGSSSFITDAAGEGYQHLQYLPFGETAVSQKLSWWSTPYQFTGKEKDDETGYNYFGARYYNSDVSVWLSVDPLAHKYPSMSAYMYCAGNPVMLVDPDGRMILNFNQNGDYIGKTHDNWFHNTFVGARGRVLGENGEVIRRFKFADPKNDSKMILAGTINKLIIVNENQVKLCLVGAGAFDPENRQNPIAFLKREGRVGGRFDFSFGSIPQVFNVDQPIKNQETKEWEANTIFLVGTMAHNHMNFGNFLYGAGGAALRVPLWILRLGAHRNSRFPTDGDGNRIPKGAPNPNGYPPQWDSKDDQLSIEQGFKYARRNNFHKLNKPIGLIHVKSPILMKTE